MCRLYWLGILLQCCCVRIVLSEASCEKFRLGGRTIFFNCGGFTNASEFATVVPRPEHSRHGFMLYNSRLEYLPVDAFEGLTALNVTFNNVHIENFEASHPNAFERLNGTLEGVGFLGRSTLPKSWSLLKDVLSLTSLRLERQTVSFDRDWNNLPRSIRSIFIKHCNVTNMEHGSLDALTGLEQFSITENKLKNFSWAMLPNPAPSLHTILLGENELTEIPKGFTPEQFPALSILHLKINEITSWDAETIDAIRRHPNNPKLYLGMIPCDCGMRVLLQIPNEQIFATCSSPEQWMHRRIHRVPIEELQC
ncbi:uncharacterized protein LOC119389018 [Rhipicephalus sanguineus]|nr:uncharacterized protein LOC119389018 [Rhipicephalus sanguineus]